MAMAVAVLAALAAWLAGSEARAATARVTYLAGGSVYVDAGRLDGIGEGDTLVVLRGSVRVARVRASFLSSHRASCDTLEVSRPIQVGDAVEYRPKRAPADAAPLSAGAAPDSSSLAPAPPARRGPRPFRGRVGIRYLGVQSGAALGEFRQPGLDARLDATRLGGAPVDLAMDVRAHRSTWSGAGDTLALAAETRVYRLALDWHDRPGQRRLRIGRQSSGAFSSVSLFDGVLAEVGGERWSAGAFGGTQPHPLGLGLSSDIVEFGAYLGWRAPTGADRRWRVELGGVSSQQQGETNRDFLFAQGYFHRGRLSGSAAQEVDVNRGWRAQNEAALAPTSTFLQSRWQVVEAVALRAGFDNRRNVRLYRDRLTPETDFDDRYRQGAWAGATVDLARHVRLDADYRGRGGGASERSHTWTGGLELYRLSAVNGLVRTRASRYRSDLATSDLVSFSLGLDPFAGFHVEASGGSRSTEDELGGAREQVRWEGVDLDLALALRWYLVGSYQHDHGDLEDMEQIQAGLSCRF